jgi:hypothetical protein
MYPGVVGDIGGGMSKFDKEINEMFSRELEEAISAGIDVSALFEKEYSVQQRRALLDLIVEGEDVAELLDPQMSALAIRIYSTKKKLDKGLALCEDRLVLHNKAQ